MEISVILCTYNRCAELVKALDSLAASKLPEPLRWEVLVVDNNSRDCTRDVVEAFIARHGDRFRYIFEGQQGKSNALNAGISQARGEVLAFLDDDVTVDSSWLYNLTSPILNGDWVGVGGRVFPQRDVLFPDWIERESPYIVGPLVMFDRGPEAGFLKEPPFGANMAFRKTMFDRHGGFRIDLGPCPGSELRGEDSEFGRRLMAAGEPIYYEPSAIVYHAVSEQRLTREYFLAWWFDKGRVDVKTLGSSSSTGLSFAGVPIVFFRRLIVWLLRSVFSNGPSQRFQSKLTAWYLAGEIVEFHRQAPRAREREITNPCDRSYNNLVTNNAIESQRAPE